MINRDQSMRDALAEIIQAEQFCPLSQAELASVRRANQSHSAATLEDIDRYFTDEADRSLDDSRPEPDPVRGPEVARV